MSTEMDVDEIPLKKRPQKASKKKTKQGSRSKVLIKLLDILQNGQCRHMIEWVDKTKKEFTIKFVHKNNPEFRSADFFELFKELDKISNNNKDQNCKGRCRANLKKLVKSGALTFMGKIPKGKSIHLKKYKLNFDVEGAVTNAEIKEEFSTLHNQHYLIANSARASSADVNAELEVIHPQVLQNERYFQEVEDLVSYQSEMEVSNAKSEVSESEKMTKRCINGFNVCETVRGIACIKDKLKIENLQNEQSHCLCLSNFNSINIIVNIPVGGASIPSVSPIGPALLRMCGTVENGNADNRTILQTQPLTAYEHEKQMNENNGILLTNSTESLNIDSKGKFTSLNCTSTIGEAMEAINLDGTHFEYSENSEMSYNSDSPNKIQIKSFQDGDVEMKNFTQLVPCSPRIFEENVDDMFSPYFGDYNADVNKPLQRDKDPFLSDRIDGLNDEIEYPMANNEDFSFDF